VVSIDSMIVFYQSFGYVSVFGVLLLCGFGLPIPEDISIIAGGIISGLGYTNVHLMCVVSLFGVLIGDIIIYGIGRHFGKKILKKKMGKRIISNNWYDRILKSFHKNGKMVLFAARFLPGLRTPIFLTAGITKFVGFGTFLLIDGSAALLSVPIWTYLGYYGASNRDLLMKSMRDTKIAILIFLSVIITIYIVSKMFKRKLINAEIVENNSNSKKK
jgi:membrane protein DedA with SNARE-associated domain